MARTRPKPAAQPIDLALQGGGSHGAFTWGVLDRLLDDETLAIDGVSGTSAGALNAAVLATGLVEGGRAGARRALAAFWHEVSEHQSPYGSCFGAWPVAPGGNLGSFNLDWNPFYAWSSQFLRAFSPYPFNPLGSSPLRQVLQRHVRIEALRRGGPALFITATAVRTGQPRVFDRQHLSIDALLASACLPQLFRAVQIDGQAYWDGGYSGTPAIWPLVCGTGVLDVLLVKINPLEQGRVDPGEYKHPRLHMVADEEGLAPLHPSSKLNTDARFLNALFELGRGAATRWLNAHRADVGVRSTFDLQQTFRDPRANAR